MRWTAASRSRIRIRSPNRTSRSGCCSPRPAIAMACSSPTHAKRSRSTTSATTDRHADPRITHALTLEVDDYGNVLKSAAVGYGRRQADPALSSADQSTASRTPFVTCSENAFTNPVDSTDAYRTPLPSESRSYELAGLDLAAGNNASGLRPTARRHRIGRTARLRGIVHREPGAEAPDRARSHPVPPERPWGGPRRRRSPSCRWASSNRWLYPARATSSRSRPGSSRSSLATR